jgi:hypothetical protein
MDNLVIKNAVIQSTKLGGYDGKGSIMTFWLNLDYGGTGQGAGGVVLDDPLKDESGKFIRRVGTAEGMQKVMDILKIVDVEKWEDLPGKPIRVEHSQNKVVRIGHYLKDIWMTI